MNEADAQPRPFHIRIDRECGDGDVPPVRVCRTWNVFGLLGRSVQSVYNDGSGTKMKSPLIPIASAWQKARPDPELRRELSRRAYSPSAFMAVCTICHAG
jgi:hypothetical protein